MSGNDIINCDISLVIGSYQVAYATVSEKRDERARRLNAQIYLTSTASSSASGRAISASSADKQGREMTYIIISNIGVSL